MLKKSKRIFSFLLALVMMAVMAVPAFATVEMTTAHQEQAPGYDSTENQEQI